jgi:hypothetical protein
MFADLLRLITRRPAEHYERGFIRAVKVETRSPRNRRVERVLLLGWGLIALKTGAVLWAFPHYHIPVNVLWVIAPTVIFAALCTALYVWRD